MNADYACEKISGPGGRNYKTATGEMVGEQARFRVRFQSAWGHLLQMTGEKTSVHKPLLSAGDVTDKGHALSDVHVFSKILRATFVEWSH